MHSLSPLRDKHRGQTFYILGCGPSLAHLSGPERLVMSIGITLGVNTAAFIPGPPLDYWVASHPGLCFLAKDMVGDPPSLINGDGKRPYPIYCEKPSRRSRFNGQFSDFYRVPSFKARKFRVRRDINTRGIKAYSTIILEAGQLAMFMGARSIVFSGVDMRTHRHWFCEPGYEKAYLRIEDELLHVQTLTFEDPADAAIMAKEKKLLRGMIGSKAIDAPFRTPLGYRYLEREIVQFYQNARRHKVTVRTTDADSFLAECGVRVIDFENESTKDTKGREVEGQEERRRDV